MQIASGWKGRNLLEHLMTAFPDRCSGTVTENFNLPLPSSVPATVIPCSALGILSWKLERQLNQRYAESF
jgi:hypothetical protein